MSEPIPFLGWLDDLEDIEKMLREQIHIQQKEIERLTAKLKELMDERRSDE